ncbi:MAG: MATE family efflux transporter [Candidatus Eremiobacteraeota bacterium]|nr:MATE family efflux transporter [Candidatus Eremiobacteraeota bacterium]
MKGALRESIALSDVRPIWQSLAIFLLPLMLSNVLQSLGQTANSVYLGRLVGVRSLAAVSAIFPIVFFLISILIGLGAGSSVLIGQAHGAGESHKIKQIAGTTLALTLVLGAIIGAVGALFAHPLLAALGTPRDIIGISESYAHIVFGSIPLLFAFLTYTTFLRGTGDTRTPFVVLIASTVLTFALTPALIVGWFGLPALRTNGAAVGNIVSTALSLAGLLLYLGKVRHPLAFDREMLANLRLRPKLVATIARIGIPTSVNLAMVSLSEVAVLSFVNRFGSTAVAAYGAVNQIVSYAQFPAISIGIAASIFSAQAIGAGRTERIDRIVRAAVTLNYVIEGILIGAVYLASTAIVSLFITSPSTVAIAHHLLTITLWSYAVFGNARVISAIVISSGTVVWPTLLSILSIWAVEVPVSYLLMRKIGLDGVWYGYPAAFVAGLLLQLVYYYGFWKKKPLHRL